MILSLLAVWVLFAAVWVALWPLLRSPEPAPDPAAMELRELRLEKARLLAEIHELELDWETGKFSEEDYRTIERRLKGRALEIMRRIDGAEGNP